MEFVLLVCLSLVTWSEITSADGPTVVQQVEKEDGDAVLSCSFGKNAEGKIFDWRKDGDTDVFFHGNDGTLRPGSLFQGRVSHFPEALQSGNASIVIRGTKVSDSGNYTCDFPSEQPMRRSIISLTVEQILKDRSAEKNSGAYAKPSIKTLEQTQEGVPLQCVVEGAFPEPVLQWKDSRGNSIEAQAPQVTRIDGKYKILLQTTVNKAEYVKCVATQDEIKHQAEVDTFVNINGEAPEQTGSSYGWIVAGVLCVVVLIILGIIFYKRLRK